MLPWIYEMLISRLKVACIWFKGTINDFMHEWKCICTLKSSSLTVWGSIHASFCRLASPPKMQLPVFAAVAFRNRDHLGLSYYNRPFDRPQPRRQPGVSLDLLRVNYNPQCSQARESGQQPLPILGSGIIVDGVNTQIRSTVVWICVSDLDLCIV